MDGAEPSGSGRASASTLVVLSKVIVDIGISLISCWLGYGSIVLLKVAGARVILRRYDLLR
jgi:hypothetical protein